MSGRENYAQGHIPGAAYVDLLGELSDRNRQGIYAPCRRLNSSPP